MHRRVLRTICNMLSREHDARCAHDVGVSTCCMVFAKKPEEKCGVDGLVLHAQLLPGLKEGPPPLQLLTNRLDRKQ